MMSLRLQNICVKMRPTESITTINQNYYFTTEKNVHRRERHINQRTQSSQLNHFLWHLALKEGNTFVLDILFFFAKPFYFFK